MSNFTRRCLFVVAAVASCATGALAQVSVVAVPPSRWAATDAALGFTGGTLENFEDTTLAPGLSILWVAPAGNIGPVTALPAIFNTSTGDPFGTAFNNGAWDGSNACVSARGNQTYNYTASDNWGDIEFQFATPVRTVGFSLQQADAEISIVINGTSIGNLGTLTGTSFSGGRAGYFILSSSSSSIATLRFDNAGGDGFVIDHLLFSPEPSPTLNITSFTPALWSTPDKNLGMTATATEDFEDLALVSGLQIGVDTPAGSRPLSATLPQTFDPLTQDPFGAAWDDAAWDGTHCLLNTRDNASHLYSATIEFGDILIALNPPQPAVAFSIDDLDLSAMLIVNGRALGSLQSLSGIASSIGRNGYVRIAAPCGQTLISDIRINNGTNPFSDGIAIDHLILGTALAFPTPPAPVAVCQNGSTAFSVTPGGIGPFSFAWQWKTAGSATWLPVASGLNAAPGGFPRFNAANQSAATLDITSAQAPETVLASNILQFRCVLGNGCQTVNSPHATLLINAADIGAQGGVRGRDGLFDNNDFVVFIDAFFALDPVADVGSQGGAVGPDGLYDNNDFVAYINLFFQGC